MRIERDQRGDYVLDASALAEKFSISLEHLRRRMRLGLVTSLVEAGEGEHAGLRRLTVRCGDEVWRAVLDADDQIVEEEQVGEPARASGRTSLLRRQREPRSIVPTFLRAHHQGPAITGTRLPARRVDGRPMLTLWILDWPEPKGRGG
jgi:hypothetical protein